MSLTNSQKKLLEEYRKLPEFSKQVLVLFSLAYLEVNQNICFSKQSPLQSISLWDNQT